MLFSSGAQHVLFFYHLVVVSAIIPKEVIERSVYSTTPSSSSKYTNSGSSLSYSSTSSSLYTSTASLISTPNQLSPGITIAAKNLTRIGVAGSSLGKGYTSADTSAVTVSSTESIGFKSSKEFSSATIIQSYDVPLIESFNSSSHSSTKVIPKSKTTSSNTEIVTTAKNSSIVTGYHDSSFSAISKTTSKSLAGNSTSKTTSSHASSTTSASKNGTTKKATSTSHKVNITSMPSYSMFGSQTITRASCKSTTLGKSADHYCRVLIGTVQLHYWPTGTAAINRTYPSTIYLKDYDITMTSPSVYFAINTMKATDLCGKQVGPTIKNYAVGYDVTDVYTLQPFANTKVTTRMGDPEQLQLSDLRTDCPQTTILPDDIFDYLETNHVVVGEDSKCNPILSWPMDLRLAAGNFWTTCGRHWGGELGIFDPPIPVTACTGDASACLYGSTKISSAPATTTDSTGSTSALADQITSTPAVPSPTISAGPSSTGNEGFASLVESAKSSLASSSSTLNVAESTNRVGLATFFSPEQPTSASTVSAFSRSNIEISPDSTGSLDTQPTNTLTASNIGLQSTLASPPSSTVVTTIGSNALSAVPESSGIILPNGSIVSAGAVVTIPKASNRPVIVSVGSSNIFVGSESYVIPMSTPVDASQSIIDTPVVIATLSGNSIISAIPSASSIIIGTQTASVDGPAVTQGANVVKLTPSGVEVGNTDDLIVTTYSIPVASTAPQTSGSVNVGDVGEQSISVEAASFQGSSTAVVDGQTISLGGSVATLTGNNIVSLGFSGVIVQAPAGTVTTIPVPSAQTNLVNMGVVDGQMISVVVGSSISGVILAIVAGQTISAGGPPATVSGGQIASLSTSRVVIQASGDYLTTIPVSSPTATVSSASIANVGVIGGKTISVEVIEGTSAAIVAGQTLSYGGSIVTLPGGNVASLGVNGVVVQAPSGKVTTIPISKTASASASDKTTKTLEFASLTTNPSVLDATSANRTGSATLVQLDNSGHRTQGSRWVSLVLAGWVGLLILGW